MPQRERLERLAPVQLRKHHLWRALTHTVHAAVILAILRALARVAQSNAAVVAAPGDGQDIMLGARPVEPHAVTPASPPLAGLPCGAAIPKPICAARCAHYAGPPHCGPSTGSVPNRQSGTCVPCAGRHPGN